MAHPSPRWRVSMIVYKSRHGGIAEYAQDYDVCAQLAETAIFRTIRDWRRANRRRITSALCFSLKISKVSRAAA